MEKFSFSELKVANVKLFTRSLTKFYCNSVNIGDCTVSCLTLRPFLRLESNVRQLATWLLLKGKRVLLKSPSTSSGP